MALMLSRKKRSGAIGNAYLFNVPSSSYATASQTVDLTSIPNYQSLTTDNIQVGFSNFITRENGTGGTTTNTHPTKSYDATTGILTVWRDNAPSSSQSGFSWIVIVAPNGFIS